MRLIILLIALLVVGLLVSQQISNETEPAVEGIVENSNHDVPKVPVKPQDVQQFERDMNKFMEDEASAQKERLDQAVQ
jgi:hypothetical protein